ncbi:STAS/SEC14 domain-containing protein [Pelotalea chapellei]|uniref:STAS/SEC14 domain-containing protein n=1 Tax=Pelotalea chapellei TaxID=44671 RepID=A0ABS5U3U0_9BACT|nr:STAS/SEC14 domain-containing protein [Pelotalea chapellei]MBT1070336.1 STAS/SEC14 domain-containing protein [Pelotalea chapellei]
MLKVIEGLPENVVAVDAQGTVTGEDYDNILIPLVENKLKHHKKIRLLYVAGPAFSGLTAEAVWDDARVGAKHWTSFDKIAVVSDVHWFINAVRFFSFIIPCPVKVFENQKLPEAKTWVSE